MAGLTNGAADFAALSRRLKDAGETGLRRGLYKAINDAAKPITREIKDPVHLRPYMPDKYAATLAADIVVSTVGKGSIRNPGVQIAARGRAKKRKVAKLNAGIITHPLFGDREHWYFQLRGMKSGFFDDVCEKSGPQVKKEILAAMHETAMKITGG
jgi:hypothetical protein